MWCRQSPKKVNVLAYSLTVLSSVGIIKAAILRTLTSVKCPATVQLNDEVQVILSLVCSEVLKLNFLGSPFFAFGNISLPFVEAANDVLAKRGQNIHQSVVHLLFRPNCAVMYCTVSNSALLFQCPECVMPAKKRQRMTTKLLTTFARMTLVSLTCKCEC